MAHSISFLISKPVLVFDVVTDVVIDSVVYPCPILNPVVAFFPSLPGRDNPIPDPSEKKTQP